MKKVIFISALAIAAAVSCTKSDIVDTKFNEAISFEAYTGRDAQTKAASVTKDDLSTVKVFGYYHGADGWANRSLLWEKGLVLEAPKGVVNNELDAKDVRYWANDSDKYTFLAYVPVDGLSEGEGFTANDPKLTYTVDNTGFTNGDVLVAVPQIERTKDKNGETEGLQGNVPLQFQHKLARLAVKATAVSEAFDFRIKEVTLSGKFYTSGTISLYDPSAWEVDDAEVTNFSFFDYNKDNKTALTEGKDDAGKAIVNVIGTKGYMMMIPVNFGAEPATLTVKYTTHDPKADQESRIYTQTYEVKTNFVMGNAYAINLEFSNDAKQITFSVEKVEDWNDPEHDANENKVKEE